MSEAMNEFLDINITRFTKQGRGMGSYIAYEIQTKTNIGIFRAKSIIVSRRFSDFLGLHQKLVDKYLKLGRIIPPVPEKDVLGTTRVRISGSQTEQNTSSAEFLERRRAALERYLRRTASYPILRIDPDFREFIESEGVLPKATSTSTISGAGLKRLFNNVVEANKKTLKMKESDPWFDQKISFIESLDAQLLRMLGNIEDLVTKRKELALHTSEFARSAAMLSNREEHTGLSRALSQLADVEEKIENLHTEQATSDATLLCELFKDYIALIGAVREAFHERVKVYHHLEHAQMMLDEKKIQSNKPFTSGGDPNKYFNTHAKVTEFGSDVEQCKSDFQRISQVIKSEFELFEKNRANDFKTIVVKYLEALVQHQMQIKKHWENFLPEAKKIN